MFTWYGSSNSVDSNNINRVNTLLLIFIVALVKLVAWLIIYSWCFFYAVHWTKIKIVTSAENCRVEPDNTSTDEF